MVTFILQLDLMNLFVKAWAWFNPITQGMEILIANTQQHFIEMIDSGIRMLCMENVIMRLRCSKKHHFLVNYALGIMLNHFVLLLCFFFRNGFMFIMMPWRDVYVMHDMNAFTDTRARKIISSYLRIWGRSAPFVQLRRWYGSSGFPWQKTRPTYNACVMTWCRCAKP